jgi:hypothetical protein
MDSNQLLEGKPAKQGAAMRDKLPGAWYDASSRVSAALSVARCIRESIPVGKDDYVLACEAVNLAVAVEELLTLAYNDIERIELELICPD